MDPRNEQLELFDELLERSTIVLDLAGAQIEGFVSGLFPAWDDDDDVRAFIAHCVAAGGSVAHALCAALGELTDGDLAAAANDGCRSLIDEGVEPLTGALAIGQAELVKRRWSRCRSVVRSCFASTMPPTSRSMGERPPTTRCWSTSTTTA